MIIKLNVYNDCMSEEPTKTYTVRRILFKTAKAVTAIAAESKEKGDDEQLDLVVKYLKEIFPDFDENDIDGIDPLEFGAFMQQFQNAVRGIVGNAEKN